MKVACFGDSWTSGWGVSEPWPSVLKNNFNLDVDNFAEPGITNEYLVDLFFENEPNSYDKIIICWSGITRFQLGEDIAEFSRVNQLALNFFKTKSLNYIVNYWESLISKTNNFVQNNNVSLYHMSVFGDIPKQNFDNLYTPSMLEFLAQNQGQTFKYSIPIFEYDWLSEANMPLTETFGKKYLGKDWKRACVEREEVRINGKYFLKCGHPNSDGHKLWADYIRKRFLND